MTISIIVPTYYRPHDLSELFDSLLMQTVKPDEVIVVDDSSTVMIENVCKRYETEFNKLGIFLAYERNPRERSSAIAKNLGAKMAKGNVFLFLDSDVVLYPDFVEEILITFAKYPDALGVGGWTVYPPFTRTGARYHFLQTLRKLFFLHRYSNDSCKYPEYPVILTKVITSNWLSSVCIAVKPCVFDEFQFDEHLKGYAYMEDVLFSRSISKRYPGKLLITPFAKCIHKVSVEGRTESSELAYRKRQYRKYVLTSLLGSKGLFLFGWQVLGFLIFKLIGKIRKWKTAVDEPSPYSISISRVLT